MDHGRCPFEKAILSAQCACELASRYSVAEQIGVECRSELARNNCAILLGIMRERARFALKVTDTSELLPFGKEMKVMIGGLIGLQRLMTAEAGAAARVTNIHALVQQAQQVYGSLGTLPYQEIVKSIAAFQGKRRGQAPAR
ncbi:MAG: hypothetical protein Q7J84_00990 [Sulfuricaulis sp.]|nr:hypothetical protein [Sulfuricaulis sp.]